MRLVTRREVRVHQNWSNAMAMEWSPKNRLSSPVIRGCHYNFVINICIEIYIHICMYVCTLRSYRNRVLLPTDLEIMTATRSHGGYGGGTHVLRSRSLSHRNLVACFLYAPGYKSLINVYDRHRRVKTSPTISLGLS